MVVPVFSYTDCMNTATENEMDFEWKHTKEDHLRALEFQFLYVSKGKFALATRRKGRFNIFLILCIPLCVLFFININQQTLLSTLGGIGAMVFVFWLLILRKPSEEVLETTAKGHAKRYLSKLSVIPTGTHRLSTDGTILEWHWVDGDERNSFPIIQIEDVVESEARLFLIRKGDASDSIPFHAFGDQETRMAFVDMIKASIGRNSDV